MFKLLFWIFVGWLVYYFLFKKNKKVVHEKKEAINEMVFDPCCNTYILKKDAIKVEIKGKTYYFCSEKCLKKFLSEQEEVKSQS